MQLTQLGLADPKKTRQRPCSLVRNLSYSGCRSYWKGSFRFFFLNTFFEVLLHFQKSGQDFQTYSRFKSAFPRVGFKEQF